MPRSRQIQTRLLARQGRPARTKRDDALAALGQGIGPGTLILLLAYGLVTVLGHSDVELLQPEKTVSLEFGGVVPGGSILAPFLGAKISIFWFYLLSPVVVLGIHAWLVFTRCRLQLLKVPAAWILANALSMIFLFSVYWNFWPYERIRPSDNMAYLPYVHGVLLILGAVIVLYAINKYPIGQQRQSVHAAKSRDSVLRQDISELALQEAGKISSRHKISANENKVSLDIVLSIVALVLIVGVCWALFNKSPAFFDVFAIYILFILVPFILTRIMWNPSKFTDYFRALLLVLGVSRLGGSSGRREMKKSFLVAVAVIAALVLPTYARSLDLAGERLVAEEPSDAIFAALIGVKDAALIGVKEDDWAKCMGDVRAIKACAWEHFGIGRAYPGWDFSDVSFVGATMARIDLTGAKLRGANLILADLTVADLTASVLTGAQFTEGNLRSAKLPNAVIGGADFKRADLSGASLIGARIAASQQQEPDQAEVAQASSETQAASETQADSLPEGLKLPTVDFSGADLRHTDLSEARLLGVKLNNATKLEKAKVKGTNFCGSILQDVDFRKTDDFSEARFRYADLARAKLPKDLTGIDFTGADLSGVDFANKIVVGTIFSGANLKNADFKGSKFSKAIFDDALIYGATFENAMQSEPLGDESAAAMSAILANARLEFDAKFELQRGKCEWKSPVSE